MSGSNGTAPAQLIPHSEPAPDSDLFAHRLRALLGNDATQSVPSTEATRPVQTVPAAANASPSSAPSATPVGAGEHIVKPGECIASIAKDAGHFWETIWNDAANSELRQARRNPNVLLPADRVHVPPLQKKYEPGQTLMRHRFRRRGEPSNIRLRVLRRDGQPRAQEPYQLSIDAARWAGVTDADGWIYVSIAGNAHAGDLTVGPPGDQATYKLKLGALQPIDSLAGVQQRLNNLGFAAGPADGVLGPATRNALLRFQKHHHLTASGQPDDPTRAKLLEQHCS